MKTKLIKNQNVPVTCAFCKSKTAYKTVHGHGFYGKKICRDCAIKLKETPKPILRENSLGEEQAYRTYGIF